MFDEMPSPPYPSRDSALLWTIVETTMDHYRTGEVDVEAAILHAAVHGWMEGHIEGEEVCSGCDHRPGGHQGHERELWVRDHMRGHGGPPAWYHGELPPEG